MLRPSDDFYRFRGSAVSYPFPGSSDMLFRGNLGIATRLFTILGKNDRKMFFFPEKKENEVTLSGKKIIISI